MFVALVCMHRKMLKRSLTAQILTWGNLVVNYYQDETSSHTRPSFYRIPVREP